MEHRYSERVPSRHKLMIYCRGVPVAIGHVRDACRDGLFVETDYAELRQFQKVECEFCLDEEDPPARHRICAHVLRQTQRGIALELDDGDDEACAQMQCLLRAAATVRSSTLPQRDALVIE
jgi:hypothetical protein